MYCAGDRSNNANTYSVTCKLFDDYCEDLSGECFDAIHVSNAKFGYM